MCVRVMSVAGSRSAKLKTTKPQGLRGIIWERGDIQSSTAMPPPQRRVSSLIVFFLHFIPHLQPCTLTPLRYFFSILFFRQQTLTEPHGSGTLHQQKRQLGGTAYSVGYCGQAMTYDDVIVVFRTLPKPYIGVVAGRS